MLLLAGQLLLKLLLCARKLQKPDFPLTHELQKQLSARCTIRESFQKHAGEDAQHVGQDPEPTLVKFLLWARGPLWHQGTQVWPRPEESRAAAGDPRLAQTASCSRSEVGPEQPAEPRGGRCLLPGGDQPVSGPGRSCTQLLAYGEDWQ